MTPIVNCNPIVPLQYFVHIARHGKGALAYAIPPLAIRACGI